MSVQDYNVHLDFTTGDEAFGSDTTVRFRCRRPGASTFVEFAGNLSHAELNGRMLPTHLEDARLQLDDLLAENTLVLEGAAPYSHDGTGVTWFQDPVDDRIYLHSMFAEHLTYLGYACFDQPDLKATFDFTVRAPQGWVVVSNTAGTQGADGLWTFPATPVMSTYITAIVAGEYESFHQEHGDIPLGLYCRQSLAQYLDVDEIFEITRRGLDFFQHRFGYPYPFQKYDQLFVPAFAAGAMENIACVTHSERMVFRSRVTDAVRLKRAETILHEMAHMWFGDLVTMRWWDDIWLNESFAEYMGFLGCVEATRFKSAWVMFANAAKANATAQDQLPTTHPIVADIPDVEAIQLNLDRITYEKGASALIQLVAWVGEDAFFAGIAAYFKAHAYGNTSLRDFLAALETTSGRDLTSWSTLWLGQAGVNTLEASLVVREGRIMSAAVDQTAPADHPTLRPHHLRVGVFDLQSDRLQLRASIAADIDGASTPISELAGQPAPDLVLVNHEDLTYAKLRLDARSFETASHHLRDLDDPLSRALIWGSFWDMASDAQMRGSDYVAVALANIDVETEAPNVEVLISRMEAAIERYTAPSSRRAARIGFAEAARERLGRAKPASDMQVLWANALIDAATEPPQVAWVRGLLDGASRVDGLAVDFDVRWNAVIALARLGVGDEDLSARELKRDPTDAGLRHRAHARAARPLAAAKEEAWEAVMAGPSLPMKFAIASGFHDVDQAELLEPFVSRYFESLLPLWESHGSEEATWTVRVMYPAAVLSQATVDATDRALARELPGPIRRVLLEGQDRVRRALRAQAFDSA
ncbi:MAG: aminopeptidase N [Candidatus Dormiibacterota bacterium]